MKKILFSLIAAVVFLGIFPSYKQAETNVIDTEVQVKLENFLGNQASISLKIVGNYYVNSSTTNLLNSTKNYTVKVENGVLGLYDDQEKVASGAEIVITPVTSVDHAIINDREYAGSFRFTVKENRYVLPINTVNLEEYVKGVVALQMPASKPMEALKAQAVTARSYAYYWFYRNAVMDDTDAYQVYGGVTASDPRTNEAVEQTAGELLTYGDGVIYAVYSKSNGGKTENQFNEWWNPPYPYYKVQTDEFDTDNDWTVTVHKQQIDVTSLDLSNPDSWWDSTEEVDKELAENIKTGIKQIFPEFLQKEIKLVSIPTLSFYAPTESGRVTLGDLYFQILVRDEFDETGKLKLNVSGMENVLADNIRDIVGSNFLKSNLLTMKETADAYEFTGTGDGHGLGLSQNGAYHRAEAGMLYKEILSFYFPGTVLYKEDLTAPEKPVVNEITDHDKVITGTTEPNSKVIASVSGRSIGVSYAGADGKFTMYVAAQNTGKRVEVVSVDQAENVSEAAVVVVVPKLRTLIGETRYSTAVKVSQTGWETAETVLLVNGQAIVDGLTATPLASAKDAPILLTKKDSIPTETLDEITRLQAKDIMLVGGQGVISEEVEQLLKSKGFSVQRVGGVDRYETSLLIAEELDQLVDVNTAFVAYGRGEPDALSIAAQAGMKKQPIILTERNTVPARTLDWLKSESLENAYFIGGTGVIAPAVLNQVNDITSENVATHRISGLDRQETNAKVISLFYPEANLPTILLAKADTKSLVDALSAGPLAAKLGSPVLLVSSKGLYPSQVQLIDAKHFHYVHQIGGGVTTSAIEKVVWQ